VCLVFGAAALAQIGTQAMRSTSRTTAGLVAMTVGPVLAAASMTTATLTFFLVGAAVAGAGAGLLFKSAISSVAAMAAAESRGEALAGIFTIAYLGLTVPVVGIGVAMDHVAATTAVDWYFAVVVTLLAATTVLIVTTERAHSSPPVA
jgi:MFS family permease